MLAPAKLNLALAVGPPSAGGYHPICSWMTTIDLYDEIEVRRLDPGTLSRYAVVWHEEARSTSRIDWAIRDDLAVRAHLALEDTVGRSLPAQITVSKRIPVGSGLGGGSSDAAATLRAVNDLYGLALPRARLLAIAGRLGSDVPFLLDGGAAIVEGFGETLEASEIPAIHAVLVFPDVACATGPVYARFDAIGGGDFDAGRVRSLALAGEGALRDGPLHNELMRAACDLWPELDGHVVQVSEIAERPAAMSGSGSTLFVLADDQVHAQALARAIETRLDLPAVPVRSCRPEG